MWQFYAQNAGYVSGSCTQVSCRFNDSPTGSMQLQKLRFQAFFKECL